MIGSYGAANIKLFGKQKGGDVGWRVLQAIHSTVQYHARVHSSAGTTLWYVEGGDIATMNKIEQDERSIRE